MTARSKSKSSVPHPRSSEDGAPWRFRRTTRSRLWLVRMHVFVSTFRRFDGLTFRHRASFERNQVATGWDTSSNSYSRRWALGIQRTSA